MSGRVANALRRYVKTKGTLDADVEYELYELADQIDAEHEYQIDEWRGNHGSAHKVTHGNGEYGHTTCSACGVTVHRRDKWCWSGGARLHEKLEVRK